MTIQAKVIADSVAPFGARLTTMEITYPRFVHAEFLTHRTFSRNAASSRAIPIEKIIKRVIDDPAMPVFWGKNQKGMQAVEEFPSVDIEYLKEEWLRGRDNAVWTATRLKDYGLHKQLVNRVLEPWMHITVVVTATEWENFYFLRRDKAAQPEIQRLADVMWDAHNVSKPQLVNQGEWHLPFIQPGEVDALGIELAKKCSAARCARVSYLNHDGTTPDVQKDLDLFAKLVERDDPNKPGHWSPLEHVATPLILDPFGFSGNFRGWSQFRKQFPNENRDANE